MDGHLTDLGRIDADAWDGGADDALPCALIPQPNPAQIVNSLERYFL